MLRMAAQSKRSYDRQGQARKTANNEIAGTGGRVPDKKIEAVDIRLASSS
jgi:hypothetical protein